MGNHSGALFLHHRLGEHATHPIAHPPSRLALLLLVAGPATQATRNDAARPNPSSINV
jgi:hypothetical protein